MNCTTCGKRMHCYASKPGVEDGKRQQRWRYYVCDHCSARLITKETVVKEKAAAEVSASTTAEEKINL